jgi:hypothetical protein
MDIEREEVQFKGIGNTLNEIIAENYPNLEKDAYSGTVGH